MAFETFEDVAEHLPRFIEHTYKHATSPLLPRLSQPLTVRGSTLPADGQNSGPTLSAARGALHKGVNFRLWRTFGAAADES